MHVLDLQPKHEPKPAPELDFEPNESTALELKHKVDALVVVDKPAFDAGEALRATIKEAEKIEIKAVADEKERRHAAWKKVVAIEKRIKERYDAIILPLNKKLHAFAEEQNRVALAAAKVAEEAAQKAAAEEYKQRETERLEEAAKLEREGKAAAAEALLNSSVPEPVVKPVVPDVPLVKVAGAREVWKYEIVDKRAYVKACLDGMGGLTLAHVKEDEGWIGHKVRHDKGKFSAPGVRVWVENSR
jgi:hypothetical protein